MVCANTVILFLVWGLWERWRETDAELVRRGERRKVEREVQRRIRKKSRKAKKSIWRWWKTGSERKRKTGAKRIEGGAGTEEG